MAPWSALLAVQLAAAAPGAPPRAESPGAPPTVLDAHRTAVVRYPEDYASWVALADAALAAGEPGLALSAWDRAHALSGGTWETRVGRTLALSAAGRHREAIRSARALVQERPTSGQAWALRGWAWRWQPRLPQRSARQAARSYRRSLALEGPADAGCGLGWSRVATGDTSGARQSFSATDAPCAAEGLRATPRGVTGEVSGLAGVMGFQDHHWRERGTMQALRADLRSSQGWWLGLTARRVAVSGQLPDPNAPPPEADAPPPPLVDVETVQQELWLHGGVRHRNIGLDGIFGRIAATGDLDGTGLTGGARAWVQLSPLTIGLSGGTTLYDDGRQVGLGVDLDLPLSPHTGLGAGLDHTRFSPTGATATSDQGSSGWLAGQLRLPELGLFATAGMRAGRELRPLRQVPASLWNLDTALLRSGFVDIRWEFRDHFAVFSGAELAALGPAALGGSVPETAAESTLTTAHLGLSVRFGPRAQETP